MQVAQWERCLKKEVLPTTDSRYTTVTEIAVLPTNRSNATRLLSCIFPVLNKATVISDASDLVLRHSQTEHYRIDAMITLDTCHYGRVYVIGTNVNDKYSADCKLYWCSQTADDSGASVVMVNTGDHDKSHTFYITMLIPYASCDFCQTVSKKLSKCERCWNKIRFPVRYCCKECQIAAYPLHRPFCGSKHVSATIEYSGRITVYRDWNCMKLAGSS